DVPTVKNMLACYWHRANRGYQRIGSWQRCQSDAESQSGHRTTEHYRGIGSIAAQQWFLGGRTKTAYRSTKFLLGVQRPDIIQPWVEGSLSDTLHCQTIFPEELSWNPNNKSN
ncbi:MAG: hypothetical protein ACKO8U_16250, partial [Pirellula sp.]